MDIFVYADWAELDTPTLMGTLSAVHTKGRNVFSFAYDVAWIQARHALELDPDLHLFTGTQYLQDEKKNFGLFLDSAPDRWGRVLMDRREAILAKKEGRKRKLLFEEDYLLGVFDVHRMGALRFKLDPNGPFLNDNQGLASPPWISLRDLEYASLQLERDELQDEESLKWIGLLLAPGASLGGARPKASVTGPDGDLWIAKFPSVNDRTDIGAWEMVVADLARAAGIIVPPAMVRRFNHDYHTYLSGRFDRLRGGRRRHFASAMTLLGKVDGQEGNSYLDLAELLMQQGANPDEDLRQLWRRIVFNIAVKNTDDHLRNHGFLLTPMGWALSPAYDVNPVYFGRGLTLNIDTTDNSLDFDLARSVSDYFRLTSIEAAQIVEQTKMVVRTWPELARKYGIPNREQDLMAPAFDLVS